MSVANTFIEEDGFGFIPRPDPDEHNKPYEIIRRYTMTNKHKASVQLISWGASIQSIKVPNKLGILGDVVLGFDDISGKKGAFYVFKDHRYIGSTIGRVVNQISKGKMEIENKMFSLSINDEDNAAHNHGGFLAFDNVNWDSYIMNKHVVMSHLSPANSEGYPGNMLTQIKYTWTDDNQLRINIRASATQSTPANITANCFMNLAGHATGPNELKKHVVYMNAATWTFADIKDNYMPTGAIHPVDHTVYDLRLPTQLTKRQLYIVPGGGYNQNLCVTSPSCFVYRFHARVLHPGSGRTLEVYSNQPGLKFSTGNDLPNPDRIYPPDFEDYREGDERMPRQYEKHDEMWGKDGVRYRRHGGFVVSPQNYPNAVNTSNFPPCIIYPGEVYKHDMTFKFGILSTKTSKIRKH